MLLRIFLAFTIIPLIELYLLFKVAQATSASLTILLVVVTGLIGSILAKSQGLRAWWRFREAVGQGRLPAREIQEGLLIAFAAALLLTPGLLTDGLGFALLIPPSRELIRRAMARRMKGNVQVHWQSSGPSSRPPQPGSGHVVDAEGVRPVEEESPRRVTREVG